MSKSLRSIKKNMIFPSMETLLFENSIRLLNSRLPPTIICFHFSSSRKYHYSFKPFHNKWYRRRKIASLSCSAFLWESNFENYGGWDGISGGKGQSPQLPSFLLNIGNNDRKHAFMFFLGLVCALAISRVRISSIAVLTASSIIFTVGILIGFARGYNMSPMNKNQFKGSSGIGNVKVCTDSLRDLIDFFKVIDGSASILGRSIEKIIGCKKITVTDLYHFAKMVESIKTSASSAGKILSDSVDSVGLSANVVELNRRRKEIDRVGSDFWSFVGLLFGEKFISLKSNKVKNVIVPEPLQEGVINKKVNLNATSTRESASNLLAEGTSNLFDGNKMKDILHFSENTSDLVDVDQHLEKQLDESSRRIPPIVPENAKTESFECNTMPFLQSNEFQSRKNHQMSRAVSDYNEIKTYDSLLDSVDFSVSMRSTKMEASLEQEQMLKTSNISSQKKKASKNEDCAHNSVHERVSYIDDFDPFNSNDIGSVISDDLIFDRYLTEACSLLKNARECLRIGGVEKNSIEILLRKCSNLLSKAVGIKPMSLLAVGQLGDTYLLLGELKLKISRDLRSRLSQSEFSFYDEEISRDKVASTLISVSEECEEFLVQSGRKYKIALSIDGNDMRALYNWGLALSFRAQLIADIGPEGAIDADKAFLAAIDKFDAMMSKSNTHAPEALFRWGAALQQRSHLRPHSSSQKAKLLQQAKRLFEDALQMDPHNRQVRDALSSCITELNFLSL